MKIAIVGAGIAGLHCANILKDYADVELFEASKKGESTRPLQMEGGLFFIKNVPELKPTYSLRKLTYYSKKYKTVLEGKIGFAYKIGGKEGIDTILRINIENNVKINYSSKIKSIDNLKKFDMIIGADGYRSLIARFAGMRDPYPYMWGFGIGSTVEGDFEIGVMHTLFNRDLSPGGYTYLIPISKNLATLSSACIMKRLSVKKYREKLRKYSKMQGYKIVNEWMDLLTWNKFRSYQKNNIFIIGGAASFTDQTFGFGLKYSIESAKLCAHSIIEKQDYQELIKPLVKDLAFWHKFSPYLLNATTDVQDRYIRTLRRFPIKQLIERGRSIKFLHPIVQWI